MIHSFKTKQGVFGFDFDITLMPEQQIYCFIGKNGVGKTQLLENMADIMEILEKHYAEFLNHKNNI